MTNYEMASNQNEEFTEIDITSYNEEKEVQSWDITIPSSLNLRLGYGETMYDNDAKLAHQIEKVDNEYVYSMEWIVNDDPSRVREAFTESVNEFLLENNVTTVEFGVDAWVWGKLNWIGIKGMFTETLTCTFKIDEPNKDRVRKVFSAGDYVMETWDNLDAEWPKDEINSSFSNLQQRKIIFNDLVSLGYVDADDKQYSGTINTDDYTIQYPIYSTAWIGDGVRFDSDNGLGQQDFVDLSNMKWYSRVDFGVVYEKQNSGLNLNYGTKPNSYSDMSDDHLQFMNEIVKNNCPRFEKQNTVNTPNDKAIEAMNNLLDQVNGDPTFQAKTLAKFGQSNVKLSISDQNPRSLDKSTKIFFDDRANQNGRVTKYYDDGMEPGTIEYVTVVEQYLERLERAAAPGYSEHHTGKAFDIIYYVDSNGDGEWNEATYLWLMGTAGWDDKTFDATDPAYQRFQKNCDDFDLSYPPNGQYSDHIVEPRHWMWEK